MIRLLISDQDQEYGTALGRAISHLHKEIEVTVAKPGCEIKNLNSFDWVLTGDEQQLAQLRDGQGHGEDHLLWAMLTELPSVPLEEQKERKKEQEPFMINRYRSVTETVAALYLLHHLLGGKRAVERCCEEAQAIAFYSPMGGAGTTSLALSTGRELCQFHNKKVFYLNFNDFFYPTFYFGSHSGNGELSDYLYYALEKEDPEMARSFDLFCCSDDYGLRTFSMFKGRNELADLPIEAMGTFLDQLIFGGGFDYVILDLPSHLSANVRYLLERSAAFILIYPHLSPARIYQEQLVTYLEKSGISCQQKTITVQNRMNFDHAEEQQRFSADIEIEEDPQSFCWTEERISISINHLFGLGVKKIGEKILDRES